MKKLYLWLLCLSLTSTLAVAQSKKKNKSPVAYNKQNKENETFLNKQWWLGARGGVNLTQVSVQKTYSIISPTNYEAKPKEYEKFKQVGGLATFEVAFYLRHFTFSFQPTYQHSRFLYRTGYTWTDDESNESSKNFVTRNYKNDQKIDHILLPLLIKYELIGNKWRPYIQGGLFQGILINASKGVTITGVDRASGGVNEMTEGPITVGAKELFAKYYWGLIGGAGVYYKLGNVRLNLDVQYKYGMSNIASTEDRNSNDFLNGIGDSMDDLNMNNLSISVGCLFPLRFLESGFKSLDHKK